MKLRGRHSFHRLEVAVALLRSGGAQEKVVDGVHGDELSDARLHAIDDVCDPGVTCPVNEPVRGAPNRKDAWLKTTRGNLGPRFSEVPFGALVIERVNAAGYI